MFQERGREDRQAREAVSKVQEDGREQWDHDRDSPCSQQAAEARGPSLERECGAPRGDGGADSNVALNDRDTSDRDASGWLLHADVHDHRVDRPRQQRLRRACIRRDYGDAVRQSGRSVRVAIPAPVPAPPHAAGAVRVVQRSGYPCTRFAVGQVWVCEGLPQESWWTLASTGETESGDGYLCHSPRAERSTEDHLRLLMAKSHVPKI